MNLPITQIDFAAQSTLPDVLCQTLLPPVDTPCTLDHADLLAAFFGRSGQILQVQLPGVEPRSAEATRALWMQACPDLLRQMQASLHGQTTPALVLRIDTPAADLPLAGVQECLGAFWDLVDPDHSEVFYTVCCGADQLSLTLAYSLPCGTAEGTAPAP